MMVVPDEATAMGVPDGAKRRLLVQYQLYLGESERTMDGHFPRGGRSSTR